MVKYIEYNDADIAEPKTVVDRLLAGREDDCESLATSECFDDEDFPSAFEAAREAMNQDYERVVTSLSSTLDQPVFNGDDRDADFPTWAGTGYRVALWKKDKRIIYLHITHIDTEMPLQLNLGVVTGPPKQWAVGC